jgi:hypothetical protein
MEFMDYMLREFTPNIMNFWIIANEFQSQAGVKGQDGKLKGDEKTLMADAMGACVGPNRHAVTRARDHCATLL